MKPFMDRDFLLDTETARRLYHGRAEGLPIFDFHSHLSVKDIAEHRRFRNLTELWLESDHYKWRAMRANGVCEDRVTGGASPYEKFEAWAGVLPRLAGCPLHHWTHLELLRFFGIEEPLRPESARRIWDRTEELLRSDGFDAVSLIARMNVSVLMTTDDPASDLRLHRAIAEDRSIPFRVVPTFRPDRVLSDPAGRAAQELMAKYGAEDIDTALLRALDHFKDNGCAAADHGFGAFPYREDPAFAARMRLLGRAYAERDMVMQLHIGPIRDLSPRLSRLIGPDAGGDSIGRAADPLALGAFLGDLEGADRLPRTLLYNLNPADDGAFSALAATFAPKTQHGAPWWFSDHLRGITERLSLLAESGTLAASVGMLTDSRSVTSFVRHEYYRRVLCRVLGALVEDGLYPDDTETLGAIVGDVCFSNAVKFFGGTGMKE